jgi:PAS domain-containing protein
MQRFDDDVEPASTADALSQYDAESVRLRLLFDHMLEGFAYCRMIYDDQGRPDDFIYLEVNPAFGPLTGLSDVVGKRVTEVIPGIKETNPELFETYGRVARTGGPEQFEVELPQLGVVLDVSVFQPEPEHFVAVFENITERKRIERQVEDLNRFLEQRVEERTNDLAEALRLLKSAQSSECDRGQKTDED